MLRALCTDKGRVKSVNQDSILLRTAGCDVSLVAVCDGMGGLEHGEQASSYVIERLNEWFDKGRWQSFRKDVTDIVDRANIQLQKDFDYSSGTTLCCVFTLGSEFYTANVGDSRAYKIQCGHIRQLTRDQSYSQILREQGVPEEQIARHPKRNALLQCIGADGDAEPVFTHGYFGTGDIFFVCSDGFRHLLTPAELEYYIGNCRDEYDLNDALEYLVRLNMERGERDNISVAAVRF